MVSKNKCLKAGFLTILWAVIAMLVWCVPSSAAEIGVNEIKELYGEWIPSDFYLDVSGTLNMYSEAYVGYSIWAQPGTEEDKRGGIVNVYGCAPGNILWVNPATDDYPFAPVVTVYGPKFRVGDAYYEQGDDITISGLHPLEVLSDNGTEVLFSLTIYSSQILIHLGQDPEQMLEGLRGFIEAEVESGNVALELEVSLLAKINAALAALENGNPNDAKVAVNNLMALVNQVEAQINKKISQDVATRIIERVNDIIIALNAL